MIFELLASTQKGVVYLPVVSLSSYLPIAGQILLMILVISLSGLFGAWLMFQRLAKKVLALETTARAESVQPVAASIAPDMSQAQVVVPMAPAESKPVRVSGARARKKEKARLRAARQADYEQVAPVKPRTALLPTVSGDECAPRPKRTLFVTKGHKSIEPLQGLAENVTAAVKPQTALAASGRLVLARPMHRPGASTPAADDARLTPQTFLVNDWFPVDH